MKLPDWNVETCTCMFCQKKRSNPGVRVECSGGCGCVSFQPTPPEVCYTCGLPQVKHVTHHGQDFCRAERDAIRQPQNFTPEPGKMYVKIRDGAASSVFGGGSASTIFRRALLAIEGLWVEVETKYLFSDQFNLVPTPGTANGLRLMERDVAEIINDIRPERKRCGWCGENASNEALVCIKCERGADTFGPVHTDIKKRCRNCERNINEQGAGHRPDCHSWGYPAVKL